MAVETVVTPHQNTPSQAAQAAEGAVRVEGQQAQIPAGEFDTTVGPGDGSPQDPGGTPPRSAAPGEPPAQRPAPQVGSPYDSKRAEITARFRTERSAAPAEEIDEYARTGGMPEEFRTAESPPENPPENPPQNAGSIDGVTAEPAPPQTFKVKVNGKEMDLTLEEMTKHAQIALASDNILDTAKAKLKEINELQASLSAQRSGAPGHQAGPGAQTTEPAEPPPAPPNQDEQIAKLIEAIQFGDDPAQARELLRNTIASIAQSPEQVQQTVHQTLIQERIRDDGARTARVLDTFRKDHPDIAEDPLAQAALERKMYDLQSEDLRALGLDPANLVEGRPTTPADIASAHQWYRANGMQVRPPDVLLSEAATAVNAWRGKPATPADPTNSEPQRGAPRVIVNRDARREAIQPQPSRSAPAPRAPQPTQAAPDRSSIVEKMKMQRATKRGVVLGV